MTQPKKVKRAQVKAIKLVLLLLEKIRRMAMEPKVWSKELMERKTSRVCGQ